MKRRGIARLRIISFSATILMMAVIFAFSSQDAGESKRASGSVVELIAPVFYPGFHGFSFDAKVMIADRLQTIVRACAHGAVYCVLGMFVTLSLYSLDLRIPKCFFSAVLVCFLYAVSDEIHQYFVPGRSMQAIDIAIDTFGSVIGSAAVSLFLPLISRKIKSG